MSWCRAALRLTGGDFDPAHLATELGLDPAAARVMRKGEPINRGRGRRPADMLVVGTRDARHDDFARAVDSALTPIDGKEKAIAEACQRLGLRPMLCLAVRLESESGPDGESTPTPSGTIPAALVRRLATLGADLDIDIVAT